MYKCERCGRIFDEPDSYEDCVGECFGSPAYETWYECPYCGSDRFDEYYEDDEEEEEEEEEEED